MGRHFKLGEAPAGRSCPSWGRIGSLACVIDAYLTDSLVWVRHGGSDPWGEPLPGSEKTVATRIERSTHIVRDYAGNEVSATGPVLLREQPGYRDTLFFDGRHHAIVNVSEVKSFGVSHYEAYVA